MCVCDLYHMQQMHAAGIEDLGVIRHGMGHLRPGVQRRSSKSLYLVFGTHTFLSSVLHHELCFTSSWSVFAWLECVLVL